MPIWIGHRFVEPDDTPPAMTVSAAPTGGAKRRTVAMANAIALGVWVCHPLLRYARVTPALRAITPLPDAPPRQARGRILQSQRRWRAKHPHGGRCIQAPRRALQSGGARR